MVVCCVAVVATVDGAGDAADVAGVGEGVEVGAGPVPAGGAAGGEDVFEGLGALEQAFGGKGKVGGGGVGSGVAG
jgi:hypothetical protein